MAAAEPGRDRRLVDVEEVDREADRGVRVDRRRGRPPLGAGRRRGSARRAGAAVGAAALPDGAADASGATIGVTA